VRLSGQDSGRGTFSQRHSVLVDTRTGGSFCPIARLAEGQADFRVYNSPLSEVGVLGSSTVTRSRSPTPWCSGRPSSGISSTTPRP